MTLIGFTFARAVYTRSALLETIDRYETNRSISAEQYGEHVCDVYDIALREMKDVVAVLEKSFPEIVR